MGWGGQEIRILRESVGMRERGHLVLIAANPGSGLFSRAEKQGFEMIPVHFRRRGLLRLVPFFKKLIEERTIDVVNTHSSKDSWLVLPAAKIARNEPLVIRTRHLSTPISRGPLNRFLYNYLPHYILTTGKAIREQMINDNGFDGDRIVSIPTGVDTNIFNPENIHADLRKELSLPRNTPLIGMVSIIRSWKGHINFINSIPHVTGKIPGARFIIAGDGPYRPTVEKAVQEAGVGDRIYFLGHREDVPGIISSLDILVHPSYANEGLPQSLLQAMAMQRPVIATDLAPLKEAVRDTATGLIVPVNDPRAMAAKILFLLENRTEAERMARNARSLVEEEYSFKGMIDRVESIYSNR